MRGERCRTASLVESGLSKMYRTNRWGFTGSLVTGKCSGSTTIGRPYARRYSNMVLPLTRREEDVVPSPIIELAVTLTWSWLREGGPTQSNEALCKRR